VVWGVCLVWVEVFWVLEELIVLVGGGLVVMDLVFVWGVGLCLHWLVVVVALMFAGLGGLIFARVMMEHRPCRL